MRLTPDESAARMRARIVEALDACGGGPLNASTLRTAAFGGGMVDAVLYADVLRDFEDDGVIRSRWVPHWVGRGGGGCRIFEIVVQRKPTTTARLGNVVYLQPLDRASLLDVVHRELERARDSGDQSDEGRWMRISMSLQAPAEEDGDTDDAAAS